MPGRNRVSPGMESRRLPSPQTVSSFIFSFNVPIVSVTNHDCMERNHTSGREEGEREINEEIMVVMNSGFGVRLTGYRPGTATF